MRAVTGHRMVRTWRIVDDEMMLELRSDVVIGEAKASAKPAMFTSDTPKMEVLLQTWLGSGAPNKLR